MKQIIGEARYQRYLDDAGGDGDQARALYGWNMKASAVFGEFLWTAEILLRNALDKQLREWNEKNASARTIQRVFPETSERSHRAWTLNTSPVLWRVLRGGNNGGELKKAYRATQKGLRESARERRQQVTHDDMVANLTFGNWFYLLPTRRDQDRKTLWEQALHRAFPDWDSTQWAHITRRVEFAHRLRNRIAHLEPITHSNLRQTRRGVRAVVQAMGPAAYSHLCQFDQTLQVMEEYPGQKSDIDWRDLNPRSVVPMR